MYPQTKPSQGAMTMVVLPQETLDEIMDVVRRAADNQGSNSASKDDEWLTSESQWWLRHQLKQR